MFYCALTLVQTRNLEKLVLAHSALLSPFVDAFSAINDLALLVDGLQAEREQGITIDVAYRYFSTQKRKFIIADTPGHEQYTRNMSLITFVALGHVNFLLGITMGFFIMLGAWFGAHSAIRFVH